MHRYRSYTCQELRKNNIGEVIKISGWIKTIRDHGGVLFLDIRDHYGITQITISEDSELKTFVAKIPKESTICVKGLVKVRPDETINLDLKTGEVEVVA